LAQEYQTNFGRIDQVAREDAAMRDLISLSDGAMLGIEPHFPKQWLSYPRGVDCWPVGKLPARQ
jgi:hypothetical protein